jgi:hypothetical protein
LIERFASVAQFSSVKLLDPSKTTATHIRLFTAPLPERNRPLQKPQKKNGPASQRHDFCAYP